MISLGTLLWAMATFYLSTQFTNHSIDIDAHPDLTKQIQSNGKQLNRIEANQVAEQIEKLDERICNENENETRNLIQRMRELLTQYKKLTGEPYPAFLLRCSNGNP